MSYFSELPQNPDFPQLEKEIMQWWEQNDILNKYLHRNDQSEKTFSFIDGPITANAPMGVHHARGRTLKDVFQRFKNLQGYAQRFQNGFDCQGLWVEVEVEKDAGFNSKKDIQNFGLDNFTNACLARIDKFSTVQTIQSKRLGYFMDWENSYYTNSKENNLYIWHFLKIVHQKGWLDLRKSATTWCPRCETGLSQHEQADGYKDITDTSVYVYFKLKDKTNEYILAWTTTPWTLTANVLLAINTEYPYVKANYEGKVVYLAKDAANRLGLTDYEQIDSKSLLNLKYESLFDLPYQEGVDHFVTDWKDVTPEDGTGVVHIAPGCGQEDYELGKKLGVPMPSPLNEQGHFSDNYGEFSGKYAHGVKEMVFDKLKSIGAFFKTEEITHRYPHCWRCKTKCLFRLENSWYIKTDEIRPLMKAAAAKIEWHPKFVQNRMQNWLDSMDDWMISRSRYYGLALPFYKCNCGELTVVGSLQELKEKAVNPEMVENLTHIHRPWIDTVKIKCPKCGQETSRVPEVGDCWLDAGVVPFSTLKYLTDKDYWHKWFPADMVLEMTEQVRLWFYSMLFFGVTLEETIPYKTVVTHSEVRDEKGERMSKTKKNGIPYDEAVEKMSADAMRWLYCLQKPSSNVNFGYTVADGVKREYILLLWNTYRFFTQHANLENWENSNKNIILNNILDKWIISRLNSTIETVTKNLTHFGTATATESIQNFVTDLSTWYIRRNRDRTDNFELLYFIFTKLSVIISPFTPFLGEILHKNLATDIVSVNLENWPVVDKSQINLELETKMIKVRKICQDIHAARQLANLKIRQPLASAIIVDNLDVELLNVIKDETNIKNISVGDKFLLNTDLTPDLIAEGEYRDFIRNIQVLRKTQGFEVKDKINIVAPTWPSTFESEILNKTLAISITKGEVLTVTKA
ncbi:MAG: isoleucine--tRNA ligase [Candidatus Shapirobacteria bacterium]